MNLRLKGGKTSRNKNQTGGRRPTGKPLVNLSGYVGPINELSKRQAQEMMQTPTIIIISPTNPNQKGPNNNNKTTKKTTKKNNKPTAPRRPNASTALLAEHFARMNITPQPLKNRPLTVNQLEALMTTRAGGKRQVPKNAFENLMKL